tara:strand:+ start:218 stop:319 length:102 start_codon:yes stop_codon:yes gene_type:complete
MLIEIFLISNKKTVIATAMPRTPIIKMEDEGKS